MTAKGEEDYGVEHVNFRRVVLTSLRQLVAREVATDLREAARVVAMVETMKRATMRLNLMLRDTTDLAKEVNINTRKEASSSMRERATLRRVDSSSTLGETLAGRLDITKRSTTRKPIKRTAMLASISQRSSNSIRRERVKAVVLIIRKRSTIQEKMLLMRRPILRRSMLNSQRQEVVLVGDSLERRLRRHLALLLLDQDMAKTLLRSL